METVDEEFGDTFDEFVKKMQTELGEEAANKMILDTWKSFSSYVSEPDELKRWYDIQNEILHELGFDLIDGLKIMKHQQYPEEPGACLYGVFNKYNLEVGIEDREHLNDISYFTVNIEENEPDIDQEIIFHSGVVFSRSQIYQLVEYVKNNDIKNIIYLIYAKYFDQIRREWIDTPIHVLDKLLEKAENGLYTSSCNIHSMLNSCIMRL